MAKFKSTILSAVSGSLAGTVFSRNRGGAYIRSKGIPTNPNSSAQTAQRASFSELSGVWRTLTDAERARWIDFAKTVPYTDPLGDVIFLTGQQYFMSVNGKLKVAGQAVVTTPPVQQAFPERQAITYDIDTGTPLYTYAYAVPPSAGEFFVLSASVGMSAGVSSVKQAYRIIKVTEGIDLGPIDFTSLYQAQFGSLIDGTAVFFKVELILSTGQSLVLNNQKVLVGA